MSVPSAEKKDEEGEEQHVRGSRMRSTKGMMVTNRIEVCMRREDDTTAEDALVCKRTQWDCGP